MVILNYQTPLWVSRRSLDGCTQSLWTPHNRENGASDQYRLQGTMPGISKSSTQGIHFLEILCHRFHWCRNRTRWFCLACGFDMMGYAWLCRYDNEGNPKPCFEAFHNKKNSTWELILWICSFRIREIHISSSCKQHQFFHLKKYMSAYYYRTESHYQLFAIPLWTPQVNHECKARCI